MDGNYPTNPAVGGVISIRNPYAERQWMEITPPTLQ